VSAGLRFVSAPVAARLVPRASDNVSDLKSLADADIEET